MLTGPSARALDLRRVLDPNRLTDACCLGFAGWTVLCHAVVLSGGSLDDLVLATVAAATALVVWLVAGKHEKPSAAGPAPAFPEPPATQARTRRWLGVTAAAGLAVWIAALAGIPWSTLWALSAAVLAVGAGLALTRTPEADAAPARSRPGTVWALALACALITLVANRPDIDDSLYVCMAQSAADAPAAPLLAHDHLHGIDGLRLLLPTYRAHSIEVLAGLLAHLTSVPAIAWLHLVFGPLAAVLAVFATARVAALVAPGRWLAVTGATVVVLLVVGNAHAWYGNFAFVRLHQGKGILATAVIPLILASGIELVRRPSRAAWLRLAAVQVAAVGTTAVALWIAPLTAMLAAVAAIRPDRRGLRVLALALATTVYPCALATGFWFTVQSPTIAPERAAAKRSPSATASPATGQRPAETAAPARSFDVDRQLENSARFVLGDRRLRLAVLGLLLWGWWVSPEPAVRRLHLVFSGFAALVLVNPYLVELLATSVTGVFTYWRIAWVLPVPLLAGCLLTAPAALVPGRRGSALALALTAAVMAGVTTHPVFGGATGARLRAPGLKVDSGYEVARALVERVPPGSAVVAPREVSPWITTFPHHPYPVVARRLYLPVLAGAVDGDEITRRIHATVAARMPGAVKGLDRRLLEVVDREPIAGVVVAADHEELFDVERALLVRGFTVGWSSSDYRIWIRNGVGLAPAASPGR
jgi:hypothetical protein